MPRSTPPPHDYFFNFLDHTSQQIGAQSQRQTTTIVDSSQSVTDTTTGTTTPGPVVAYVGQIPSGFGTTTMDPTKARWIADSRPIYGLQIMDTNTGVARLHVGTQPDATHGMWSLDDNGDPVLKVGEVVDSAAFGSSTAYYGEALFNSSGALVGFLGQGPHGPALSIYDNSGNLRAQLGEQASGDYGLLVENTDGSSQEILPQMSNFVEASVSTASSTWVNLAGSPSVTATLGHSGDALISMAALIGPTQTNASGLITLEYDGNTDTAGWLEVSNSGTPIACSASTIRTLSGTVGTLTPGSHTFKMQYESSNGTVNFSAMCLTVQPL